MVTSEALRVRVATFVVVLTIFCGLLPTERVIEILFGVKVGPCNVVGKEEVGTRVADVVANLVGSYVIVSFTKDIWFVPGFIITSKLTFCPTVVDAAGDFVVESTRERVVAGVAPTLSFCCCWTRYTVSGMTTIKTTTNPRRSNLFPDKAINPWYRIKKRVSN